MAGDQSIRTSFDHAATPNPAPIKINLRYVALRAGSHGPMVAKYRNRTHLINEIVLTLSLYIAWLEDDE